MPLSLNPVTKKLLNNYFQTQPALNKVGVPASKSGILLGDLIESALNGIKPGLDTTTKNLLNAFPRTQPALNRAGAPAANSGILLGDILDSALKKGTIGATGVAYTSAGVGPWTVTVASPLHGLVEGAVIVVANGGVNANGSHTIHVVDPNSFTFTTVADPSSGTLDWSISRVGDSYTSAGVGPYTVTITSVAHGLDNGATITVSNDSNLVLAGPYTITLIDPDTFSIDSVADPTGPGTLDWTTGAIGVAFTSLAASWLVTVASPLHGLSTGFVVTVSAGTAPAVNGSRTVTFINVNSFRFPLTSDPGVGTLTWSYSSSGLSLAAADQKLLNAFSKTQPALNAAGVPAANSGILLGDLLALALA